MGFMEVEVKIGFNKLFSHVAKHSECLCSLKTTFLGPPPLKAVSRVLRRKCLCSFPGNSNNDRYDSLPNKVFLKVWHVTFLFALLNVNQVNSQLIFSLLEEFCCFVFLFGQTCYRLSCKLSLLSNNIRVAKVEFGAMSCTGWSGTPDWDWIGMKE